MSFCQRKQNKTEQKKHKNIRSSHEPQTLFEKINTIENPLTRWNRKGREKRKGKMQIFHMRNKSGHFTMASKVRELHAPRIGDLGEVSDRK